MILWHSFSFNYISCREFQKKTVGKKSKKRKAQEEDEESSSDDDHDDDEEEQQDDEEEDEGGSIGQSGDIEGLDEEAFDMSDEGKWPHWPH